MKVLVTGGTGFIGTHVARTLAERGHEVATLSRRTDGLPGLRHHSLDVTSPEAIQVAPAYDAIAHFAAISNASGSYADPYGYNRNNLLGVLGMLEAARQGGARVVFASTQRIYRPSPDPIPEDGLIDPQDPYAYSKLCGERSLEMYRRFFGVHDVTVRFFSVYGPGLVVQSGTSGVAGIFVGRALRGERLVAHTNQLRDLTYVGDVAWGTVLALEAEVPAGSCYNVATGLGTSMEELAQTVRGATRSSSEVVVEPGPSYGYCVADISKVRRELGYSPRVSLLEGLERYIDWYRAQG